MPVPESAWTLSDLELLERAIADGRGVKTLAFDNQTVSFHSLGEMLQLRAVMIRVLSGTSRQGYRVAATSKGL